MNRSVLLSIVLSIIIFSPAWSADPNQCMVHLDKSFYAVGENIQYSLYLPQSFEDQKVAVKTVLLDSKGMIKATYFSQTEGGISISGLYKIPYQYAPGVYYLQFMAANKVTNQEVLLAEAPLPIYNYLEGIVPENATDYNGENNANTFVIDDNITATLPETVSARDVVNATIQLEGSTAYDVSVSVVNEDIAGNQLLGMLNILEGSTIDAAVVKDLQSDTYAKGKLTDKSGSPIKSNILGAYSTLEDRFLFTRSSEEGDFFLTVPAFAGAKPMQIVGYSEDHEVINVTSVKQYPIQDPKPLLFNDRIKEYLELARMRKKIEQHFDLVTEVKNTEESAIERSQLDPDASYDIKEYSNFENMAEFFKEVLTPLRFREKKGTFEAFMFNPKERSSAKKYFKGAPLFIINGRVTRNGDYVAKLPMDKVDQVDLFFNPSNLRKQFNAFGRYGVVKIITNDSDLSVPKEDFDDSISVYGAYRLSQDQPDMSQISKDIPVLSPQVFWMQTSTTSEAGPVAISYTQPDDAGSYSMTIVAKNAEGNSFKRQIFYTVD